MSVVEKAVSDKLGSVSFHFTEPGVGEASLYKGGLKDRSHQSMVVEAITLDKFFEIQGWPVVDVVKMDVEGAEKVALMGMKQLVLRNPSLKLVIEFSTETQANAGVSPREFFDTLINMGFQKIWIINSGLKPFNVPDDIPRLVQIGWSNLFCERQTQQL